MSRRRMPLLAPGAVALALLVACGGAAAPTATPTRPAAAPTTAPAAPTAAAQPSPTPLPGAGAVPTPAPTPTKAVAKTRGRVVIASSTYADFEPDITKFRSGNTRPLVLNINDTLVGRNEEGKWYGLLSESWTAAPDKWTFKIKKGVKFHDGT
ncbi:MAG: hypothetical protein HY330_06620, partial [Chloroflexi bacterium]|nr:hypothetical protein [Chloroflexota bacterium]